MVGFFFLSSFLHRIYIVTEKTTERESNTKHNVQSFILGFDFLKGGSWRCQVFFPNSFFNSGTRILVKCFRLELNIENRSHKIHSNYSLSKTRKKNASAPPRLIRKFETKTKTKEDEKNQHKTIWRDS